MDESRVCTMFRRYTHTHSECARESNEDHERLVLMAAGTLVTVVTATTNKPHSPFSTNRMEEESKSISRSRGRNESCVSVEQTTKDSLTGEWLESTAKRTVAVVLAVWN